MLDNKYPITPTAQNLPELGFVLQSNRFHVSKMTSPPSRLQTHLYKHPADAELQRTRALFKAENVVVIHLLLAVCGGDGGRSGGLW